MALTKLTTDLIDGTIVTSVNGSTGAVTLETGTDWQATPKTADFTAVAGEGYFVNTTSAAITVTLPSSPSAGNEINLVDYAGTAATNNITITSSDNINGSSNDVLIDYERGGVSMVYVDATQGWIAYNAANETATALPIFLPSLIVDYLVVAGAGGGGGRHGGGGGAGGLRTSYDSASGGGSSAESSLSLLASTNYTVTVGSGGAGGVGNTGVGISGNNSVFTTITSIGGGGGSNDNDTTIYLDGGSGGGGTYNILEGSGTAGQGYNGGAGGLYYNQPPYVGGGGGGASQEGYDGNTSSAGDGGDGLAVNILNTTNAGTASVGEVSGSDVYYAGGGGGGNHTDPSVTPGSGGIGGGANGGGGDGNNGTDNTGGGGGGSNGTTGGTGGSGVVILRYPSAYSITVGSGITEASGSPFTEGSDKVSVFKAGTGNISFS